MIICVPKIQTCRLQLSIKNTRFYLVNYDFPTCSLTNSEQMKVGAGATVTVPAPAKYSFTGSAIISTLAYFPTILLNCFNFLSLLSSQT